MRNLMQKFAIFMQGRYGMDTLNNFLVAVFFVLWIINIFVFNTIASLVIDLLELAVIIFMFFRMLSRNINKRSLENRKFTPLYNSLKNWFSLTIRKFKERKDFRYLKCPVCKAQLRVKNKKGKHTVRCPRCGSEFEKKI